MASRRNPNTENSVDLPVPFAPTRMARRGTFRMSTSRKARKFRIRMRSICIAYPVGLSDSGSPSRQVWQKGPAQVTYPPMRGQPDARCDPTKHLTPRDPPWNPAGKDCLTSTRQLGEPPTLGEVRGSSLLRTSRLRAHFGLAFARTSRPASCQPSSTGVTGRSSCACSGRSRRGCTRRVSPARCRRRGRR